MACWPRNGGSESRPTWLTATAIVLWWGAGASLQRGFGPGRPRRSGEADPAYDGFEPGSKVLEGIIGGWPRVLADLKALLETGELTDVRRLRL